MFDGVGGRESCRILSQPSALLPFSFELVGYISISTTISFGTFQSTPDNPSSQGSPEEKLNEGALFRKIVYPHA